MRNLVFLLALFVSAPGSAQSPHWQNPEVVNVNKLPARATSISYPTKKLAIEGDRDASPRKKSLNGKWKFSFYNSPEEVPENIFERSYPDGNWGTIPVPSNWELHGYGKPWQRLTHQIWKAKGVKQPNIPTDYNPTGIYRRKVSLPKDWKGMQITLHVGAASSALTVWVNGKYVGYSEDNRLPAEFDITPYLMTKENLITFQVSQWSDGSYLEDQDHWRMSGITREVYLEASSLVQLYDFAVRTDLDDEYKDAKLQIRPQIKIYDNTDVTNWILSAELFDNKKQPVLNQPLQLPLSKIINERYPVIGNRPFENLMEVKIKNPKKWSAEYPNLYTLVLTINNTKGRLVESRSTKVGFREIDISEGQFKINGVPVLLYGVNRHDWDANTGKSVTKEAMKRDAQLMKMLNVNASRSSHYPNPPYWYELCDEYGIYVMDEANIESHGHGSLFSNIPAWNHAFMERGIRMVERDKNYPSIISWSLGNEAGFGSNHAALSAWIKEFDPTRPVHAEGAQNIYGYKWPKPEPNDRIYTDFVSRMYRLTEDMIDLATKPDDNRPVIWCEYAHAQGNSTGDLETYWKAIRKYPRFVGGFVWDWRDQLISKKSEDGRTLWAHGTDFKQKQEDLNPVQKGLISADGQIKSGGWQAKKVWQRMAIKVDTLEKGKFFVHNRHFRTNLNQYDVHWEITREGIKIADGQQTGPDIEAGETGRLEINIPQIVIEPGMRYYLNISLILKQNIPWAEMGYSVAQEQFLWSYLPAKSGNSTSEVPAINENASSIEISAKDVMLVFDKVTGALTKLSKSGEDRRASSPQPNFWRAATDNDLASGIYARQSIWKKASNPGQLIEINASIYNEEAIVHTVSKMHESGIYVEQHYKIDGDGNITLDYKLSTPANLPDIPRVGWRVEIPSSYDKFTWFGRGPLETYSDKKSGSLISRYEQSVKNDYTYYVRPQESSNKTDVYWLELTDNDGKGIRIESVDIPLSVSAWPFSQEQIERAGRIEELTFGDNLTLNVDMKQMGVGGDNTWNIDAAPHQPFRILAKDYRYSFKIKLL